MSLSQRFSYTNETNEPVRLLLEPWAEQYVIQHGQKVDVLVTITEEASDGVIEFVQESDMLIIYAYTGTVISLSTNGKELPPDTQIG